MKITLRDYQKSLVDLARDFFARGGKKAIVCAPTGAGKTIIFCKLSQMISEKNKQVLIITDRKELLKQTGNSLNKFNVYPELITPKTKELKPSSVYVAMNKTLQNRLKLEEWQNWLKNFVDIIIIDEAHKQDFNHLFLSGLINNTRVLSFTATPIRSGKMRQLAYDYEETIETVTVSDLIQQGHLVDAKTYTVAEADTTKVKYSAMNGDYQTGDLFQAFDSPKLYAGVVKNWRTIAEGTQTICFCVNIEHVLKTTDEFVKNGISAKFVCSGMSKPKGDSPEQLRKAKLYDYYKECFAKWSGDRDEIIEQFMRSEFMILVNAGIATTGFDCPSIQTVIVNRATLSKALYFQMIGRGSRPYKGKEYFSILDFGGNVERFGHYSQPQQWSLWHEESRNVGEGVPPLKDCKVGDKGCDRLILASKKVCPFCGLEFPKKKAKEVELVTTYLDPETKELREFKKVSEMEIEELEAFRKAKGRKMAWLWIYLYSVGGRELIREAKIKLNWSHKTYQIALRVGKQDSE